MSDCCHYVRGSDVRPCDILVDHDYSVVLSVTMDEGVVVTGRVRRIDGSVGLAFWGINAEMSIVRNG